ncbi:unnamed protein product [Linum trigynum]|uniref:Homeobox domain-containing protein n=1 Tax=Linum trigynum TaxID=586398 RepID=A0AAV2DZQ4_9ROSI
MAEGYHEAYHVPQQSRRDKLRVVAHSNQNHTIHNHLYDPCSFLSPSDFLSSSSSSFSSPHNFMGFVNNYTDPTTNPHHLHINPSSSEIHHLHNSNAPFLNFPNHHPSPSPYASDGLILFKPEPLSLSLSSSHHQHSAALDLNFQRYLLPNVVGGGASAATPGSASNDVVSRCSDVLPLGPFTGYASILKESRFLKPAQQLLEELSAAAAGGGGLMIPADRFVPDPTLLDPAPLTDDPLSDIGSESRRKKSRLISMLDEVYRRYKQYYQQMQAVMTSFECVAGLGNAAPYANLALKAMSKHFRSLKSAITDQLGKASGKDEAIAAKLATTAYGARHVQSSSGGVLMDHHQPVWRPQRGLPERAVTVLRAWLFEHFLHPYPTDTDKLMLAKQTGLTRSQVSNWFINARVRLWKPMVEEIHMLETRQAHKAAQKDGGNRSSTDHPAAPMSNSDNNNNTNPSTSSHHQRTLDVPMPKRTRNELATSADMAAVGSNEEQHHHHHQQQLYVQSYGGGMSGSGQSHVGLGMGGSGVSLTLGLHQGMGLLEPPPSFAISSAAAQRFGLEAGGNDGYVMGGFEGSQNRHFGRDFVGGQLLHDFVG